MIQATPSPRDPVSSYLRDSAARRLTCAAVLYEASCMGNEGFGNEQALLLPTPKHRHVRSMIEIS